MSDYTNHEFFEMVRAYIESGENLRAARRLYASESVTRIRAQGTKNPNIPNARTILAAKQRLLDYGQFRTPRHAQGSGRKRKVFEMETEDLPSDENENSSCPQVVCSRCRKTVVHTTEEDQTKKLIAKVYHYFESEYEELKERFGDLDLTPLSQFRQRTVLATGVSEKTLLQILKEERTQDAEKQQETNLIRARKRSMHTESSTMEDSSDYNVSDCEQPTEEQGSENEAEIETLVVKLEPDCDKEQVQTNPDSVQVKAEPPDADQENTNETLALTEPATKRKARKTPRKDVTFPRQNTHEEPSTSGASSSFRLTAEPDESGLLAEQEVKVEQIEIGEEGFS